MSTLMILWRLCNAPPQIRPTLTTGIGSDAFCSTQLMMFFVQCPPVTVRSIANPFPLKKLQAGDCSWGTMKLVLRWIINTVEMTISLPLHRVAHLADILSSFPRDQRRTSAKRWHETLDEL
jgi:hypothetical protein